MSVDLLRTELARLGHAFFGSGTYDLNLIGLRAASDESNLFDDTFLCVYKDAKGEWHLDRWKCTTDPGRPHLTNPMRRAGCAIVVPGQYRGLWKMGPHKGKPALVQATPVKVWRDMNNDTELDRFGKVDEGLFGINCHRAGADSAKVELWSAGCQVFKRAKDFEAFLAVCRQQVARGKGWDSFSYTLVDVGESPALAGLLI